MSQNNKNLVNNNLRVVASYANIIQENYQYRALVVDSNQTYLYVAGWSTVVNVNIVQYSTNGGNAVNVITTNPPCGSAALQINCIMDDYMLRILLLTYGFQIKILRHIQLLLAIL